MRERGLLRFDMALPPAQQEPHWDARTGLVHHGTTPLWTCLRHLYRSLPTSDHAALLVEAALDHLQDRGRLDPYTGDHEHKVLQADPDRWWLRRSPVLLSEGTRYHAADRACDTPGPKRPADAPEGWTPGSAFRPRDPVPDISPAAGRASLTFRCGAAVLELHYDDQGLAEPDRVLCRFGDRWAERKYAGLWAPTTDPRARPAQAPPPAWLVDFPGTPLAPEALARRILKATPAADPVRVRMTVDAPGGVEGCWFRARRTLRKLAGADGLPDDAAGILLVDAYDRGEEPPALAVGRDLAEAERAWREVEGRVRPRPKRREPVELPPEAHEPPPEPPEPEEREDGSKVLHLPERWLVVRPVREIPWPIPGPGTTPVVALPLPGRPSEVPPRWRAAGFARWRVLIGDSGVISFAVIRDEDDGYTQVGEGLLDVLDPEDLAQGMAEALTAQVPFPHSEPPWLKYPYEHRSFWGWSNMRQAPGMRTGQAFWGNEWNWADMDGDHVRWQVVRMRLRR